MLFNAKLAIFQLYHGEKLHFNEMIMMRFKRDKMSRKEIKEAVGKYLFLEEYPFIVYIS
jgi:hypothetical protein